MSTPLNQTTQSANQPLEGHGCDPASELDDGLEADATDTDDELDGIEDIADALPLEDTTDVTLTCDESTMRRMIDLLTIQNKLNSSFVGDDWIARATDRSHVDYIPPILDEVAELIRSLPQWKFWKTGQKTDLSNAHLELIDILHFTLSEAMTRGSLDATVLDMGFWYDTVFGPNVPAELSHGEPEFNFRRLKTNLNRFLISILSGDGPIIQAFDDEPDHSFIDWEAFWLTAHSLGLSGDRLYATYIAKVALNHFRIAKGDKVNVYCRTWWENLEDNHFLMLQVEDWCHNKVDINLTVVTNWLETRYGIFLLGNKP